VGEAGSSGRAGGVAERTAGPTPSKREEQLHAEVARLRAVVAELSAETLQLKKGT